MNQPIRLLTTTALAALVALAAGCGGGADDAADASTAGAAAASSAARREAPASGASIAVTPVVSLGQTVTIAFTPGSYASGRLFLNWICYQDGAQVSHDGSYELHEAVQASIPGYAQIGDRFEWQFTFEPLQSYYGGAASCEVIGWYVNRKSQWIKVAGGTFAAQ